MLSLNDMESQDDKLKGKKYFWGKKANTGFDFSMYEWWKMKEDFLMIFQNFLSCESFVYWYHFCKDRLEIFENPFFSVVN